MPYFQHSAFSIISLSLRDKERERGGRKNWRGDKETHSMDYTRTYTHKYAYTHAGTHCMSLCLISPVVYQGDQEFNTVKFPVDKTVFGDAGPNECWAEQRRRRKWRRKNWRRWEEDDKRALRFNCLPDTFTSSSSPSLIYKRKLPLTDASDTEVFSFICQERVEGLWWQFNCDSNWQCLLSPFTSKCNCVLREGQPVQVNLGSYLLYFVFISQCL